MALPLCNTGAQEGPVALEFNFSNPGARSLGFGGAFAALADDATAAFANPAGLVQLARPEISLDGRLWSYSTPFSEGGRLSGPPSGVLLDNTPGIRTEVSSETVSGPSFASFVVPRGNWSFAGYRHQSANFKLAARTQGFFRSSPFDPQLTEREDDFRISTDFEVINYGVAAAYRLTDALSFGLGVTYVVGKMTSRRELFLPLASTLPEGPFGANIYDPIALEVTTALEIDSSDLTFNGGLLWQASPRWSLGAFYRQGPDFDLRVETVTGPAETDLPVGTVRSSVSSVTRFPSVFGVGLTYRSRDDRTTVSFEWDHVGYSTIIDNFERDFGVEDIALDDADELHLGLEYAFLRASRVLAVRAGVWLDPDHRIRYVGEDDITRALLRSGEDVVHYAAGFGVAFQTFQIDMAIDLSERVDTASVSAIYSF